MMQGILSSELRERVIQPVLSATKLYSQAVENLLLGTAAQESHMGYYLHQCGGPALGIYQIEPNTHYDIWTSFLAYRPDLSHRIEKYAATVDYRDKQRKDELITNLSYATLMARMVYYRVAEPLPAADDVQGLAVYWKRYYNTAKGSGKVDDFIANYHRHI